MEQSGRGLRIETNKLDSNKRNNNGYEFKDAVIKI